MSGQCTAGAPGQTRGRPLSASVVGYDEQCPYLPDRVAGLQGFFAERVEPAFYRELLDHSFRRSGKFFYRPSCDGCNECTPLRVLVNEFHPSRSQRRCRMRNGDIAVEVGRPEFSAEKGDLYVQYVRTQHGRDEEKDMGAVRDFLYNPVVETVEFTFRAASGQLLAVSICDVMPDALSSVYCFYDVSPTWRQRGLGTYTALCELDYARGHGLAYYYLGYLVRGCRAMSYKIAFRPHQLLNSEGAWRAEPC